MTFGEKLRELRSQKHVSQDAAARAIGISARSYKSYELDERCPRDRQVYISLAQFYGVPVEYLLTEDEEFVMKASEQYGPRGMAQAMQLVSELSGMFAGGELSDSDKDAVMFALQNAYFKCKQDNQKYTPKKYRKDEPEA